MKKLLLILSLVLLAGRIIWTLVPHHPLKETAIHMGVGDNTCDQEGYLTPNSISFAKGDKVRMQLINVQATALEVKGLPGGSLTLKGNTSATREFTADKNFGFSTWVKDTCQVAKGSLEVTSSPGDKVSYLAIGIFALLSASLAWINWGAKAVKFSGRKQ